MEEIIDLREYFTIIKKKWFIIAVITLVCIGIASVYSFFIAKPVYQADTTLIVKTEKAQGAETISNDQVNASQKLAITYGEIIKSRTVLDDVIKNLRLKMSYYDLLDGISVSTVTDTQIIKVSITSTDKNIAAAIANEIPKVFAEEAMRITDANGVEVIDNAKVPTTPIKPNKKLNIAMAGVLGIMIGIGTVFLMAFMDNKIRVPQDVDRALGLPLLGVVPDEF